MTVLSAMNTAQKAEFLAAGKASGLSSAADLATAISGLPTTFKGDKGDTGDVTPAATAARVGAESARDVAVAAANASKIVNAPAMLTSTSDSTGRVAEYIDPIGHKHIAYAQVRALNGVRPEALILEQKFQRANFLSTAAFIGVVGQSLAATTFSGDAITTSPAGRAIVAPWDAGNPPAAGVQTPASTSFVEATVTAQGGYGESPLFALVNEPYGLLDRENALPVNRHNLIMATGNCAYGGTAMSSNNRGTTYPATPSNERYRRGLNQLSALRQWCIDSGTPLVSFGRFGMVGEVEQATNSSFASVKSTVQGWARDIVLDDRAIVTGSDGSAVGAGQTFDPVLFVDTTCAYVAGTNVRATPRAVLAASIDYFEGVTPGGFTAPPPVVHTMPTFPLGVPLDPSGVHTNADGSHAAGAFGGLAIKRVFIDADPSIPQNRRFPPMYIIGVRRIGNTVLLKWQMRTPQSSFARFDQAVSPFPDGNGIAEQQDYGIGVWDGSALLPLAVPKVVGPDEIAITLSSGIMASGLRIGFGIDRPAAKMLFHTGAAVNLRDNYGDLVKSSLGYPLHSWVSPQAVILGAGPTDFTRFS